MSFDSTWCILFAPVPHRLRLILFEVGAGLCELGPRRFGVFSKPHQVEIISTRFGAVAAQLGSPRSSGYAIKAVWRNLEGGLIRGQRVGMRAAFEQQVPKDFARREKSPGRDRMLANSILAIRGLAQG